jgi:adenosylmethionine-8-amino-7-oxononanoate aminotransferase
MLLFSPDLLRRLRAWADAHGVWLIADEIAAGMGRLGPMLASHLAGPSGLPDLAVISKGLTGGVLPLAAVAVPDHIYDLFDADWVDNRAFVHSNTYCGNPLACAVANAAFRVYADEDIAGHVARIGPVMRESLLGLAQDRPWLRGVRGCGMMAAVDLRRADGLAFPRGDRVGYRVYRKAVRRGALLRPLGDTMYLFPPLNASVQECSAMAAILGDSIDAVLGGTAR